MDSTVHLDIVNREGGIATAVITGGPDGWYGRATKEGRVITVVATDHDDHVLGTARTWKNAALLYARRFGLTAVTVDDETKW